jgi:SAM-dependent methyltransferase/acyl carrier protein
MEYELLQKYGLCDGMDVLDCGCGPGRLIELLKRKMPGLRFTGLEMDQQLVESARLLLAERGLNGCSIFQGTAEQPGLAEAAFDFIIIRLVLEHVPDPILVLRSLRKLLRPGGRMVVISNDFEFHLRTWPPVPELERLYEAYRASRRRDGGDPCIGRRVPQLLSQAGLAVVGNEVETAHNSILGDKPFLKAEGGGIPAQLVRTGFLEGETLEEMTRSWRTMLSEPDHSIVRPLFVAVGERTKDAVKPLSGENMKVGEKGTKSCTSFTTSQMEIEEGINGIRIVILKLVTEALKEKLEEAGKNVIQPGDLLVDLGLDSLTALNLQEIIKGVTGIEVPLENLLENVSVGSLADYLETESARRGIKPKTMDIPQGQPESTRWEEGEI